MTPEQEPERRDIAAVLRDILTDIYHTRHATHCRCLDDSDTCCDPMCCEAAS